MTVADFIFNIAKGKLKYYAELPATNDAFLMIPLLTAGLATDAVLKDLDDVGTILAGSTDEQTTMGRKTVTGVAVTVDDTNDWVDIDFDDLTWVAATGGAISSMLLCYDPDTTGGTDSSLVPLAKFDFAVTPNGGDITVQVPAGGALRAA